ncbi:MAG: sigma-70 family RNA polymerase sigma factor [Planctomycetota bacterium]
MTDRKHPLCRSTHSNWSENLYRDLRRIARNLLGWRRDLSLESGEVVHEAWAKLCDESVQNEEHRLRLTVAAMRQIVIDYLRRRRSAKRGGNRERIPLIESAIGGRGSRFDWLEFSDALEKLKLEDERCERAFVLHVYGGLTHVEIAELMQISKQTVGNDYRYARAFLRTELSDV